MDPKSNYNMLEQSMSENTKIKEPNNKKKHNNKNKTKYTKMYMRDYSSLVLFSRHNLVSYAVLQVFFKKKN